MELMIQNLVELRNRMDFGNRMDNTVPNDTVLYMVL